MMKLTDEQIDEACAHLGEDRDKTLDRGWLYSQLALARQDITHDVAAVTNIRKSIKKKPPS